MLGYNGSKEIKSDPFFDGVCWDGEESDDFDEFDIVPTPFVPTAEQQEYFKDFDYTSDWETARE
jgi:hypothetical protein